MQTDFYITAANNFNATLPLLHKLISKARQQALAVHIHCQDQAQAQKIDDQLWAANDISFIPHEILNPAEPATTAIHLGYGDVSPQSDDLLINFAADIPGWHQQFKRIIEIVNQSPDSKNVSRQHYAFYKAQAYELESHDLS